MPRERKNESFSREIFFLHHPSDAVRTAGIEGWLLLRSFNCNWSALASIYRKRVDQQNHLIAWIEMEMILGYSMGNVMTEGIYSH